VTCVCGRGTHVSTPTCPDSFDTIFSGFSFMGATCRSLYGPYDQFLATSLAQLQQSLAAGAHPTLSPGVADPRLQVR
jgi:hypothetical protein